MATPPGRRVTIADTEAWIKSVLAEWEQLPLEVQLQRKKEMVSDGDGAIRDLEIATLKAASAEQPRHG